MADLNWGRLPGHEGFLPILVFGLITGYFYSGYAKEGDAEGRWEDRRDHGWAEDCMP